MIDIKILWLTVLGVVLPIVIIYFLADWWQRGLSNYIQRTDLEEYEKHWRKPQQRAEREFAGNRRYIWDSEKRTFLDPREVNQQNSGEQRRGSGRPSSGFQAGASRSSYSSTSAANDDGLGTIITGMVIGSALSSSSSGDDCSNSHNSHHNCSSSSSDSSSSYDSSSSSYDSGGGWDSGGSSSGGGDW